MNESNGKLELDNWIHMGIVHVVNQTQSMFEVIQIKKGWFDGFNGSMHVTRELGISELK